MKIAHIITGLKTGGAELQLYRLVINTPDYEHIIISLSSKDYYGKLFEEKKYNIYCLELSNNNFFKNISNLKNILINESPTIIQTWMEHSNFFGGLISYFFVKKNIIWCVRTSGEIVKDNYWYAVLIFINSFLSFFIPKKIIFNSNNVMKSIYYKFYPRAKKVFIPNGIEIAEVNNSDKNNRLIRIGIIASWRPEKDHANFFKAFSQLPEDLKNKIEIILAGSNMVSENKDLNKLVNKYNIDSPIEFLGFQSDINLIIRSLDLIVIPSRSEGFSNVLLESMLCRVPCISTNVGDAKYIIGDYGWVVPSGNSKMLKGKIEEVINLFNNKDYWGKITAGCRNRVIENFSIKLMVEKYSSIWENLISK